MSFYYSKISIKKTLLVISLFLTTILLTTLSYSENKDNKVKRVISFVCDDSFSMLENGQDYYYANYTLQNMVGMMNETDELNVVYLSDVNKNNMHNMSNVNSRINYIKELKSYTRQTTKTDFAALDTAVDYLENKKLLYGSDNSYKYYLVVITDGNFDNYPNNFSKYLSDLRDKFIGAYFKGIFIGVGDKISSNLKSSVLANDNYHYISSNGNEDIVNAVFEAHDLIYNRELINEDELNYFNSNKSLWFNAKANVNKLIILEQNQNAKVLNVESENIYMDHKLAFECDKINAPILKSVITHTDNKLGPIPKGRVNIDFDNLVNKSYNNARIFVEYTGAEAVDKVVMTTTRPTTTKKDDTSGKPIIEPEDDGGDKDKPVIESEESGTDDSKPSPNKPTESATNLIEPTGPIDPTTTDEVKPTTTIDDKKPDPSIINWHFCPCPIVKLLLILFLICLLKSLYDRKQNRNIYRTSSEYNNKNYERYKSYEDYYNKRIAILTILILLMLLLLLLCHLFWCRCTWKNCLTGCWWWPRGCGCARQISTQIMPVASSSVVTTQTISPITPTSSIPPITPTSSIPPTTILQSPDPMPIPITNIPVAPFIVLGILGGYLFKNRFDTKYHGFEKWQGKNKLNNNNIISVNSMSKFIPYISESGMGSDLSIKATNKIDRVIVPKKFLTPNMKLEGESVDLNRDLILYENMRLTDKIDGKEITYIYKHYPGFETDA